MLACMVSQIAYASLAYLQSALAPLPKLWIARLRMAAAGRERPDPEPPAASPRACELRPLPDRD
eukprot:986068-Pleurochrysis_carterae.AAC.8